MRDTLGIIILAAFLVAAAAGAALAASNYELPLSGRAKVSKLEGTASLHDKGADGMDGGETALAEGDQIEAPATVVVGENSRLELTLPEGSLLRFSEKTDFTLVSALANIKNREVEVDVAMGDCWASVKDFLGDTDFSVNSPTAVAGVSGTRYRLNVSGEEMSSYYVYNGAVEVSRRWKPQGEPGPRVEVPGPDRVPGPSKVTPEEWTRIVSAGYVFTIRPDGRYDMPTKFDLDTQMQDPWVEWNMQRDKLYGW